MSDAPSQRQPEITAWMKPSCGWSNGVRAVFQKYGLPYDDRDIINNPSNFHEMVRLTGQRFQPCVLVGESLLADVSGEELEEWLIENKVVEPIEEGSETPLDRGCADHSAPPPSDVELVIRR
ncbi:MAG: glutaredoxin [Candidatus Poribacteria bacterium]|nr:glutaredoxin [Candidatus Poribacteria bacterium]